MAGKIDTQVPSVVPNPGGSTRAPYTGSLSTGIYGATMATLGSFDQAGQNIARDLQAAETERDVTHMVKASGAFSQEVEPKLAGLDRLASDYSTQVDGILKSASDNALKNADLITPRAQEEMQARVAELSSRYKISSMAAQRTSISQEAVRTWDTAFNNVGSAIRSNPANADGIIANWKTDSDRLLAGVDTDTRRKVEFKMNSDAKALQALGYADKGQFAMARNVVKQNEGVLDPSQEWKVTNQIDSLESKARADNARYVAGVTAGISAKLADWSINPDPAAEPPVSRQQLQNMYDKGVFTNAPGAYVTLVHQLDGTIAHRQAEMASTIEALNAFRTNTIKNGDQVDLAFVYLQTGKMGKAGKAAYQFDPTNADQANQAAAVAKATGYIPSMYKNFVNNTSNEVTTNSNDPNSAAKLSVAAGMYDHFNSIVPHAKWGDVDQPNTPVAMTVAMAHSENITMDEAARRVVALGNVDTEVKKARGLDFDQKITTARGTNRTSLQFMGGQVRDAMRASVLDRIPGVGPAYTVAPEVANAFMQRYKENYISTGDLDTSRKAAEDYARQNFAVTRIGANDGAVVQFAPEHFIPASVGGIRGVDTVVGDIMNREITDKLAQAGIGVNPVDLMKGGPGGKTPTQQGNYAPEINDMIANEDNTNPGSPKALKVDPQSYRLFADDETTREARQFSLNGGSGPVTFALQVKDQYGVFRDVRGPRFRVPNADEIMASPEFKNMLQGQKSTLQTNEEAAKATSTKGLTGTQSPYFNPPNGGIGPSQ